MPPDGDVRAWKAPAFIRNRTPGASSALAVGAALVSLLLTVLMARPLGGAFYVPLLAGVVVSALLGGAGAGLLTLAVAGAGVLLAPVRLLVPAEAASVLRLGAFLVVAAPLIWLGASLRHALLQLEARLGERDRAQAALRETGERLRAILDSTVDAILTIDERGRIQHANQATAQLFGWGAQELVGQSVSVLMPEPDRSQHDGHLARYLQGGKRHIIGVGREVLARRRDGTVFPADLAVSETRLPDGARLFTGIVRDLSQRRRAEAERERLMQELREAVRVRDEFLGVAAHELRTPLTPLQLTLQVLLQHLHAGAGAPPPLLLEKNLRLAQTQVRRLTELVTSLLDVSRIREGRLPMRPERVDLAAVARDVSARFEEAAARAGSTLVVETDPCVEGEWDPARLEEVLVNLLSNAIKYGAGRPVRVRAAAEPGGARLSVQDEGIGIATEDAARIFERFERAVSDRHYGGLGLGLYITQRIVEAMQGSITVESAPGRGATFTVRLPRSPPAAAAGEEGPRTVSFS